MKYEGLTQLKLEETIKSLNIISDEIFNYFGECSNVQYMNVDFNKNHELLDIVKSIVMLREYLWKIKKESDLPPF